MRYVFVFIHVVALEQISESIFTVNNNIVTLAGWSTFQYLHVRQYYLTFLHLISDFVILKY